MSSDSKEEHGTCPIIRLFRQKEDNAAEDSQTKRPGVVYWILTISFF